MTERKADNLTVVPAVHEHLLKDPTFLALSF